MQVEFAQKDLERARPLMANSTISQQVFDQRNQAVKTAEANVLSAEASVRSAELDVEFTQIRAPITGRISRKLISEGNYITGGSGSGTLLTTIVSTDPIYFYFDISEADFLKYKRLFEQGKRPSSRETANPIEVGLQGDTGFPIKGQMNFVDNRIDPATGSLRERATFQNPDGDVAARDFLRVHASLAAGSTARFCCPTRPSRPISPTALFLSLPMTAP